MLYLQSVKKEKEKNIRRAHNPSEYAARYKFDKTSCIFPTNITNVSLLPLQIYVNINYS